MTPVWALAAAFLLQFVAPHPKASASSFSDYHKAHRPAQIMEVDTIGGLSANQPVRVRNKILQTLPSMGKIRSKASERRVVDSQI